MGAIRRHPVRTALAVLGLSILLVVGGTFVAVWRAAHVDDASRIEHVDLIVVLGAADGMEYECAVNLDHLQTVARGRIGALLTTLGPRRRRPEPQPAPGAPWPSPEF